MNGDIYDFDGNVRVAETITYYRYVPRLIYEIDMVLKTMKEEEQTKVAKYIERITGKRYLFPSLARPQNKKALFKELDKISKRTRGK